MTEAEYADYLPDAEDEYAQEIHASGAMSEAEAREKSREDYARLLPQGLSSPGCHLWTAYDGPTPVALLWLKVSERTEGASAFVYDVQVRPELRRRGYGRAVMLAAEELCREHGVTSLGLNVFGGNHAARSLYEQLGFTTTAVQMVKPLALPGSGGFSG
jgi:ribosomal protein S18 acetylase RimI-like enzyme